MAKRFQVIVVGGGPVGVALAVDLGMRGISCALVETRVGLSTIPKGQNLTQRTMEHFQFWGLADELRAARIVPEGYPIGEVTFYRSLMSRILARAARPRDGSRLLFPGERAAAAVPDREGAARQDGRAAGRRGHFGWTAKTVEQDEHGVRVAIEQEGGPGREMLEADYRGRLRRPAFAGARADRHRARRHRFRSAHGAARVPLARPARGAGTVSAALDLPGDAPGPATATGSSSAASTSAKAGFSTRRCRPTARGRISISMA